MKPLKLILAIVIVTWLIVGAVTVIPHETAHKVSYLGYKAVCPFAPYSTVISFAAATVFFVLYRKANA
jgi:hypothetical protein